jgi:hypothetical protein
MRPTRENIIAFFKEYGYDVEYIEAIDFFHDKKWTIITRPSIKKKREISLTITQE